MTVQTAPPAQRADGASRELCSPFHSNTNGSAAAPDVSNSSPRESQQKQRMSTTARQILMQSVGMRDGDRHSQRNVAVVPLLLICSRTRHESDTLVARR